MIYNYSCELIFCPVLPVPSRADILNYLQEVDAILWSTQYRLDKEILDRAGIMCSVENITQILYLLIYSIFVLKFTFIFEGPRLRVISTLSSGYEHLDVVEAQRRGIKVGHTPNINTRATAEIAMGLLLEVTRRIPEARECIYK